MTYVSLRLARLECSPRLVLSAVGSVPTLLWVLIQASLPAAALPAVNAQLEKQILETIQKHPEVILESLNRYHQRQEQKEAEKAQKVAEEIRKDPSSFVGESPVLGDNQASQYLFIFSDFQCPFCAKAQSSLREFKRKHPEVALVYKHLPLTTIHPQAVNAAAASWAAQQQGKFWSYHDILLDNQSRFSDAYYEEVATQLGLNLVQFNRDRKSQSAYAAVAKDAELAERLGLKGTPFFIVNGQGVSGVVSSRDLEAMLSASSPAFPNASVSNPSK